MAELPAAVKPRAHDCPRCGAALRFADEDGTLECVCGWSERTPDILEGLGGPWEADDDPDDPPLLV